MEMNHIILLIAAVLFVGVFSGLLYMGVIYVNKDSKNTNDILSEFNTKKSNSNNYDIELIHPRDQMGYWESPLWNRGGKINGIFCDGTYCYTSHEESTINKVTMATGKQVWVSQGIDTSNIYSGAQKALFEIFCSNNICDATSYGKIARVKDDGTVIYKNNDKTLGVTQYQSDPIVSSIFCEEDVNGFCFVGGDSQIISYRKDFSVTNKKIFDRMTPVSDFNGNGDQYIYSVKCDATYCYAILDSRDASRGNLISYFIILNKADLSIVKSVKLCENIPYEPSDSRCYIQTFGWSREGIQLSAFDISCDLSSKKCYIPITYRYPIPWTLNFHFYAIMMEIDFSNIENVQTGTQVLRDCIGGDCVPYPRLLNINCDSQNCYYTQQTGDIGRIKRDDSTVHTQKHIEGLNSPYAIWCDSDTAGYCYVGGSNTDNKPGELMKIRKDVLK